MKNRKSKFNMIELTLALGLMALGLTLIIGLFPIAMRGHSDMVANTYVPLVADQFMTLLQARIGSNAYEFKSSEEAAAELYLYDYDDSDKNNFLNSLPDKSILEEGKTFYDNFLRGIVVVYNEDELVSAIESSNTSSSHRYKLVKYSNLEKTGRYGLHQNDSRTNKYMDDAARQPVSLYSSESTGEKAYAIVFKSKGGQLNSDDTTSQEEYNIIDFAAQVVIYKDTAYANSAFGVSGNYATAATNWQKSNLARLALHISWPLDRPLADRHSRVYHLDFCRGELTYDANK